MTDDIETLEILRTISGGRELIAWFGGSPNFGDAEIVGLYLDRAGASNLVLMAQNYAGPKNWARITFHLKDMIDVTLEGFSHQNVIGGLKFRRSQRPDMHPSLVGIGAAEGDIEFIFEPCAGAFGTIRASLTNISIDSA